jgi:hypothetical protein
MIDKTNAIKKKVMVRVEEQNLEFFLSRDLTEKDLKNIFSLVLPGYPSNFTLSYMDNLDIGGSDKFCKIQNISISGFSLIYKIFSKNLLQSIYLENEVFKEIKSLKEIDPIRLKTKCEKFSNPYLLFSFNSYMESNFNRLKSRNYLWSTNEKCFLKNYIYHFSSVGLKIFLNKMIVVFRIMGNNFTKILYCLILLETLSVIKSVSRIEVLIRIFLKFCFLSLVYFFFDFIPKFFEFKEKNSSFWGTETICEKELSITKTLLFGIIRSGNMCSI